MCTHNIYLYIRIHRTDGPFVRTCKKTKKKIKIKINMYQTPKASAKLQLAENDCTVIKPCKAFRICLHCSTQYIKWA